MRVTIALDRDIVEHFKRAAAKRGALPYQTQINQALRRVIEEPPTEALKSALLKDKEFIRSLAREIAFEADRVRDAYSPPGNTNRYRFTMMVPASS